MKNLNLIFIALLCLVSNLAVAQNSAIKGGADLKAVEDFLAFGGKIALEYQLAKKWSINASVEYNTATTEENYIDYYDGPIHKVTELSTWSFIPEGRFYLKEALNGVYFNTRIGVRSHAEKRARTENTFTELSYYNAIAILAGGGIGISLNPGDKIVIDLHASGNFDSFSVFLFDVGMTIGYAF